MIHPRISDSHTNSFQSLILCSHSIYIYNSASYHCPIELSSGSESEGRGQVCQRHSSIRVSDTYSRLEIKNSTLYIYKIITVYATMVSRCGWYKSQLSSWEQRFSGPLKDRSLGHSTGVGHDFPGTDALSPIQSGGEGNGGCKIQRDLFNSMRGNRKPRDQTFIQ